MVAESVSSSPEPYRHALDQLEGYGLVIEDFVVDGVLHRVGHRDDRPRKKDGWYVAQSLQTQDGRELLVGAYGWWKDGHGAYALKANTRGLSEADRARVARQRRDAQARAKQERAALAARAAERAKRIWEGLPELGKSDYLGRKAVRSWGLRFTRGTVVVPVRRVDGALAGLQFIGSDGGKKFLTGTLVKGAFHLIGDAPKAGQPLAIAEGYATAATVHQATGWPCAVAFDCGNLGPVSLALRTAYPRCRMVFAGDDDGNTAGNPGRTRALDAARAVDGVAVFPVFSGPPGTDWNDLSVADGEAVVRQQLMAAVGSADSPPPPSRVLGVSFDFSLAVLLDSFVLIYGTETVFDGRIHGIVSLAALRAAAGRDVVKLWLENADRRTVMVRDVVFEPSGQVAVHQVNLFSGWPVAPESGSCARLLALLYYLVGENDQAFHWLLCWCAYPLQHPGAKLRTAVVMHGPEGTGKNLWWNAVRDIYGEYGAIITQTELESQFNGWASRKLFCIGNEVVSRAEMFHQKGRLKNMITEGEWQVNEKMLPLRSEANHANFVFLSNVIRPAAPDPDDRRYMVVWTPPQRDKDFYLSVVAEQRREGAGALYEYLLRYDCGDFDEHTKPFDTDAKRDLIEASMESHELFYHEWEDGDLPVPFGPCRAGDLYAYYRTWCVQQGERHPAVQKVFGVVIGKRLRWTKTWVSVGSVRARKKIYLAGDWQQEEGVSKEVSLGKAVEKFWRRAGLDVER